MKALKHTLLSSVIMAAAGAVHGDILIEEWSYAPLYDDWRLSKVMEGAVFSNDGHKVGEVHDVILDANGLVDAVVVEQEVGTLDWDFYLVDWAQTDFHPSTGTVSLDISRDAVDNLVKLDEPTFAGPNEMEASNLLGMDVNLDGSFPYGEVDDLLISRGANDLTAYVVESDGLGSQKYALPADVDAIDYDAAIIEMPYDEDAVTALDWFVYGTG